MAKWKVEFNNLSLGGFAPAFWLGSYPTFGNTNQMFDMTNCDLIDPTFITQGAGLSNLTDGTQASVYFVANLKSILDFATATNVTYAIGGNRLHKLSASAMVSDANWSFLIDKATVTGEDGEDVAYYKGAVYFTYNHSGSGGDCGKVTLPNTFDVDYMSTVPTGAAALVGGVPHPMIVGGNDFLYIANGALVSSFDGTTFVSADLDLPNDFEIQDIEWTSNRLWIAGNRIDVTGTNKNYGSIYIWDGNAPSWEDEIIIGGRIGATFIQNGILFIFYQDVSDTGGYKLGYLEGRQIKDVAQYTGSLPNFGQVTQYKGFIAWVSSGEIWCWGGGAFQLPTRLFQYADAGYATGGALASPFGDLLVSSDDGAGNRRLAKLSGYDVNSNWKTLTFDVTGNDRLGQIDKVKVYTEKLATGAREDIRAVDNKGTVVWASQIISYTLDGAATYKEFNIASASFENFRLEGDRSNGSATNAVKIKKIIVEGHTLQ